MMDLKTGPIVERRKNSGIIMNGQAEAWVRRLQHEVETTLALQAATMRKDFYRACFIGVVMVFGACLAVAWVASKTDSRIGQVEGGDIPEIERRLESIEKELNGIKSRLPSLTIGTPDGWENFDE